MRAGFLHTLWLEIIVFLTVYALLMEHDCYWSQPLLRSNNDMMTTCGVIAAYIHTPTRALMQYLWHPQLQYGCYHRCTCLAEHSINIQCNSPSTNCTQKSTHTCLLRTDSGWPHIEALGMRDV
jgi:hypothetical protein